MFGKYKPVKNVNLLVMPMAMMAYTLILAVFWDMIIGAIIGFMVFLVAWAALESFANSYLDTEKTPYLAIFCACIGALVDVYLI